MLFVSDYCKWIFLGGEKNPLNIVFYNEKTLKAFWEFVNRKKSDVFILAPADDMYYHWLFVIAAAVLYNWCLLVAR